MRRIAVLFGVLAAVSVQLVHAQGPGAASRAPLQVPAHFESIQEALEAARPGDVIYVAPGTYCGQVLVSKSGIRIRQRDAEQGQRPVLSPDCPGKSAYGFKVAGTAASPVADVEISGFVVDGFGVGILLENAVHSRVTSNEVSNSTNASVPGSANGIQLVASSFNEISANFSHDNGHMGIGVRGGAGNLVSGNRLLDNQKRYPSSCSLMLYFGTTGNQIVENVIENESIADAGLGIMVGGGSPLRNLLARNRVVGHLYAGIEVEPGSQSNVLLQNDARGNGLLEIDPDLVDINTPSTNLWIGNLGNCSPGNAGC